MLKNNTNYINDIDQGHCVRYDMYDALEKHYLQDCFEIKQKRENRPSDSLSTGGKENRMGNNW